MKQSRVTREMWQKLAEVRAYFRASGEDVEKALDECEPGHCRECGRWTYGKLCPACQEWDSALECPDQGIGREVPTEGAK